MLHVGCAFYAHKQSVPLCLLKLTREGPNNIIQQNGPPPPPPPPPPTPTELRFQTRGRRGGPISWPAHFRLLKLIFESPGGEDVNKQVL